MVFSTGEVCNSKKCGFFNYEKLLHTAAELLLHFVLNVLQCAHENSIGICKKFAFDSYKNEKLQKL
jgi:hypothetical protein